MGIEAATYITDLVNTNPLGTDKRSTADDHSRLIKAVLLTTFPGANGAITATSARMNLVFTEAVLLNAANVFSSGSIDMATGIIDNAQLQSYSETFSSKGDTLQGISATLDLSVANNFALTIATASLTVSFANWPASGILGSVTLEVSQDATGGRTILFPTAVKWPGGVKPVLSQSLGTVSSYAFTSRDNGAKIYGYQTGFNQK